MVPELVHNLKTVVANVQRDIIAANRHAQSHRHLLRDLRATTAALETQQRATTFSRDRVAHVREMVGRVVALLRSKPERLDALSVPLEMLAKYRGDVPDLDLFCASAIEHLVSVGIGGIGGIGGIRVIGGICVVCECSVAYSIYVLCTISYSILDLSNPLVEEIGGGVGLSG